MSLGRQLLDITLVSLIGTMTVQTNTCLTCSKFVWVGSKVGKAFTKNSWKIVKAKVMKCAIKKISLRFMKHTYLKIIFFKITNLLEVESVRVNQIN